MVPRSNTLGSWADDDEDDEELSGAGHPAIAQRRLVHGTSHGLRNGDGNRTSPGHPRHLETSEPPVQALLVAYADVAKDPAAPLVLASEHAARLPQWLGDGPGAVLSYEKCDMKSKLRCALLLAASTACPASLRLATLDRTVREPVSITVLQGWHRLGLRNLIPGEWWVKLLPSAAACEALVRGTWSCLYEAVQLSDAQACESILWAPAAIARGCPRQFVPVREKMVEVVLDCVRKTSCVSTVNTLLGWLESEHDALHLAACGAQDEGSVAEHVQTRRACLEHCMSSFPAPTQQHVWRMCALYLPRACNHLTRRFIRTILLAHLTDLPGSEAGSVSLRYLVAGLLNCLADLCTGEDSDTAMKTWVGQRVVASILPLVASTSGNLGLQEPRFALWTYVLGTLAPLWELRGQKSNLFERLMLPVIEKPVDHDVRNWLFCFLVDDRQTPYLDGAAMSAHRNRAECLEPLRLPRPPLALSIPYVCRIVERLSSDECSRLFRAWPVEDLLEFVLHETSGHDLIRRAVGVRGLDEIINSIVEGSGSSMSYGAILEALTHSASAKEVVLEHLADVAARIAGLEEHLCQLEPTLLSDLIKSWLRLLPERLCPHTNSERVSALARLCIDHFGVRQGVEMLATVSPRPEGAWHAEQFATAVFYGDTSTSLETHGEADTSGMKIRQALVDELAGAVRPSELLRLFEQNGVIAASDRLFQETVAAAWASLFQPTEQRLRDLVTSAGGALELHRDLKVFFKHGEEPPSSFASKLTSFDADQAVKLQLLEALCLMAESSAEPEEAEWTVVEAIVNLCTALREALEETALQVVGWVASALQHLASCGVNLQGSEKQLRTVIAFMQLAGRVLNFTSCNQAITDAVLGALHTLSSQVPDCDLARIVAKAGVLSRAALEQGTDASLRPLLLRLVVEGSAKADDSAQPPGECELSAQSTNPGGGGGAIAPVSSFTLASSVPSISGATHAGGAGAARAAPENSDAGGSSGGGSADAASKGGRPPLSPPPKPKVVNGYTVIASNPKKRKSSTALVRSQRKKRYALAPENNLNPSQMRELDDEEDGSDGALDATLFDSEQQRTDSLAAEQSIEAIREAGLQTIKEVVGLESEHIGLVQEEADAAREEQSLLDQLKTGPNSRAESRLDELAQIRLDIKLRAVKVYRELVFRLKLLENPP